MIGHVAYRFELPPVLKRFPDVFYVRLLKIYNGVPLDQSAPLYWKKEEGCFEIDGILKTRSTCKLGTQYLFDGKDPPTICSGNPEKPHS